MIKTNKIYSKLFRAESSSSEISQNLLGFLQSQNQLNNFLRNSLITYPQNIDEFVWFEVRNYREN